MPQLDPAKALFIAQLFWLFVIFAALYVCMAFYIVPRLESVFSTRKSQTQADIERADALREQTQSIIDRYETQIAQAKKDSAAQTEAARAEAAALNDHKKAELAEKLSVRLAEAEKRIEKQRQEALESIQSTAAELTLEIIAKAAGIKETAKAVNAAVKARV